MTDPEKEQQIKSVEKRYKGRIGFKNLFNKAQRIIYAKDILQPQQREFKEVYKQADLARKSTDRAVAAIEKARQKELDEIYRNKPKNVITYEEKTLRDIHREHPKMVGEEDIIRWK